MNPEGTVYPSPNAEYNTEIPSLQTERRLVAMEGHLPNPDTIVADRKWLQDVLTANPDAEPLDTLFAPDGAPMDMTRLQAENLRSRHDPLQYVMDDHELPGMQRAAHAQTLEDIPPETARRIDPHLLRVDLTTDEGKEAYLATARGSAGRLLGLHEVGLQEWNERPAPQREMKDIVRDVAIEVQALYAAGGIDEEMCQALGAQDALHAREILLSPARLTSMAMRRQQQEAQRPHGPGAAARIKQLDQLTGLIAPDGYKVREVLPTLANPKQYEVRLAPITKVATIARKAGHLSLAQEVTIRDRRIASNPEAGHELRQQARWNGRTPPRWVRNSVSTNWPANVSRGRTVAKGEEQLEADQAAKDRAWAEKAELQRHIDAIKQRVLTFIRPQGNTTERDDGYGNKIKLTEYNIVDAGTFGMLAEEMRMRLAPAHVGRAKAFYENEESDTLTTSPPERQPGPGHIITNSVGAAAVALSRGKVIFGADRNIGMRISDLQRELQQRGQTGQIVQDVSGGYRLET